MNEPHGIPVNIRCEEKNLKVESLTQRLREREQVRVMEGLQIKN